MVAHHVSVMTVQAAAARRVLATDPELAAEALSAIEEMGRTAMAEMRNIVGVLRTDGDGRPSWAPQPGVRDLPALVEQMREAGLRTQLWVEGEGRPLPAGRGPGRLPAGPGGADQQPAARGAVGAGRG